MNILLWTLPRNLPAFARKAILAELFEATADAFECPVPAHDHLSFNERLQAYALFTSEQATRVLQAERDIPSVKERLYKNTYPLGERLRNWLGVHTMAEVMGLGQILYRAIGVDIEGDSQGYVTVRRCYFSRFYSGKVCDLISALDHGIFSGLAGGGRLVFSERLTEGSLCCRARLQLRQGEGR